MINIEILIYFGLFWGLYFAIFVLGTFFENKDKILKIPQRKNWPQVCLIVPCFNEEKNIEKTLQSLIELDYPQEKLEIIVVDDGSQDQTFFRAKVFKKRDQRIKVFRKKKNGGKYTALNFGLKKTRAEFVGSVDADSYLEKDALKKIIGYFDNPQIKAVISTVKVGRVKNLLEGVQYIEYLLAAFLRKIFSILDSVNVAPGPLSVFRKEVFEILGPYRKAYLTEDLEIALRLQRANFKIAHAIEAIVYTQPCPNFRALFRQRLRWRRGFLLNLKDYRELLNFKKHGNLSFFLAFSLLGSFLSISLVGVSLWELGRFCWQKISQISLVGLDFSYFFSPPSQAWLERFNLKPSLILGLISLLIILSYLLLSKKFTFERKLLKKNILFYFLFYNFLNALWWICAFFSLLVKREIKWK